MTAIAPPPVVAVAEEPTEPESSGEPHAPAKHPWSGFDQRTLAVLAAGTLALFLLVAWTFEGPIASLMFTARQHGLGATFSAPPPKLTPGQAIAVMQIPSLKKNVVVVEGDGPDALHGGPGHRPGTVVPGAKGNSVIEGHRNGWGAPFSTLNELQKGDLIAIQNRTVIQKIVFKVQSVKKVKAGDVRPFANSTDRRLTLVTGSGGWLGGDRLVVTGVSGPVGRTAPGRGVRPGPDTGSVLANMWLTAAVWAFAAAIGAVWFLRSRFGRLAVAAVVVPLCVGGALALLLELDRFLPPLR